MSANDGGPAFPFVVHGSISEHQAHDPGMSLRDYFAGQVLAGWHAASQSIPCPETTAREAYRAADAMLRARAEKGVGT